MFWFFLYLKTKLSCLKHNLPFEKTDVFKGKKLYDSIVSSMKKSKKTVNHELNSLYKYWHCFPDTYFRFGMFMKDFGDMELMKTFIPQQAYARYAADKDSRYHILIDDKILFHNIARMYGIPVPERFFVFQDNIFCKNGQIISDMEVDEILNQITDERVFIKRYRGGAGSGISIAVRKEDGLFLDNGQRLTASAIRDRFSDSNYIFEKQIVQEKTLARFNPDSVNTIRILTYKNKPISAAVRFGGKGDYCDNISKGGMAVSINLETGELGEYGMRMYDIEHYYEHPYSHLKFKGVTIPNWNLIIECVNKALSVLPYYNSIGFDIATTNDGPIIVEINSGAGINLSQTGKYKGIANIFK